MASIASLPAGARAALLVAFLLHAFGLWWGMPASDAWDNDGIAPRDFLPGVALTFMPGNYFTYPPLHLAFLSVLTLPVTLVAVVRAKSTNFPDVLAEIISPPYMTIMAMTARFVALAMSLVIVVALAKIAGEIASPRRKPSAMTWTAWFATLGVPFTFYSHTSNLDVPYLFWSTLALLWLTRAIARHEPQRLRVFALLAACGVATKDQAYAIFLFAAPAVILLWILLDRAVRENLRSIGKELAVGVAMALLFILFVDGAITNPSGFRKRLVFLSGAASQDFAAYSKDAAGRWFAVVDTALAFRLHYPMWLVVFVAMGFVSAVLAGKKQGRSVLVISLVPALAALSFTLAFNLVARRVEERFTLPQALFVSVYGGIGMSLAWTGSWFAQRAMVRPVSRAVVVFAIGSGLYRAMAVDAMLWREARYEAEAFLRVNVKPGDDIEVHGLNAYLPRFPAWAKVARVGSGPTTLRNPLPGVREVQAPLMNIAARRPRWIVVSDCYAWRFERSDDPLLLATSGRIVPVTQKLDANNEDATRFFRELFGNTLGYHRVNDAQVKKGIFPAVYMHASLGCRTYTFERNPP
ncbi:MAG: glycosyltransferase family 39 protein [Polyangiaceae bacterium]|nr:glycosyltransferase family 39 protein [Polyangiaceae bacterium]